MMKEIEKEVVSKAYKVQRNRKGIYFLFTFFVVLFTFNLTAQNVGINGNGAVPDASAILDISAAPTNNKGMLIPRLTTTQRNSIISPAHTLLIFNTTTNCYEWWDNLGGSWVSMGCGCTPPSSTVAGANPNPICVGANLNLTGT